MTLQQLCKESFARLSPHYGEGEARWLVRVMMEHLKGYSQVDIICNAGNEVTGWLENQVRSVTDRLLSDVPIQYIFSQTTFYGLKLKVTPATLIPRPETEELVGIVVDEYSRRRDLAVLDACTGSGCIALALARNLPFAKVDAFDVSDAALDVARHNNSSLSAHVRFFKADALRLEPAPEPLYDLMVSNPPYIADSERAEMAANVLDHEPHQALFVPDSDPLRFYRALSDYAAGALRGGGGIYFEINPLFSRELADGMERAGWDKVTLLRDTQGKYRFLTARRSES